MRLSYKLQILLFLIFEHFSLSINGQSLIFPQILDSILVPTQSVFFDTKVKCFFTVEELNANQLGLFQYLTNHQKVFLGTFNKFSTWKYQRDFYIKGDTLYFHFLNSITKIHWKSNQSEVMGLDSYFYADFLDSFLLGVKIFKKHLCYELVDEKHLKSISKKGYTSLNVNKKRILINYISEMDKKTALIPTASLKYYDRIFISNPINGNFYIFNLQKFTVERANNVHGQHFDTTKILNSNKERFFSLRHSRYSSIFIDSTNQQLFRLYYNPVIPEELKSQLPQSAKEVCISGFFDSEFMDCFVQVFNLNPFQMKDYEISLGKGYFRILGFDKEFVYVLKYLENCSIIYRMMIN